MKYKAPTVGPHLPEGGLKRYSWDGCLCVEFLRHVGWLGEGLISGHFEQ